MPAAAIAETVLDLSTQHLLFAGRPVLLRTNSPQIAKYARDFLPESRGQKSDSISASAFITIHVREADELCNSAPLFRARSYFALARFTSSDSFWFNLRTREVYGTCSPQLANDSTRWHRHIFPALLGILSATIDVAPVHAACLVQQDRGVLLAGTSGTGKSTLTITMAKRGFTLLSDDWTYLSETKDSIDCSRMQAWGLPVPVKLLPDASTFFPELLAHRPALSLNGEIAYEVCPEKCFEIARKLRCPVTTVILLERMTEPGCSIIPIEPSEAVHHLQSEVEPLEGVLAHCYKGQLEIIQRAVSSASCYRFFFNERPDKVAEALEDALANMN